jgi:hypothetical protein
MRPLQALHLVTPVMKPNRFIAALLPLVAVLLLMLPLLSRAAEQRTFPTPEAAVDALHAALKANDVPALVALVGDRYKDQVDSGDSAADAASHARAAALLDTYRRLDERGRDRRVLLMGAHAWPMPVPLVRNNGVWRFAAEEGAEELLNRRIGRNERNALLVLRASLDAQRQYASKDRDGDGVLQYAAKLGSTPTRQDGLYWPADASRGEEVSPFGPLVAGNPAYDAAQREQGDPYQGYHFRILTRQGRHAPGGAYHYVINGRMIAGFALVAYPAEYGESGVKTFMVSHNGKVYEKDLGKNSRSVGEKISSFDPGPGWKAVRP